MYLKLLTIRQCECGTFTFPKMAEGEATHSVKPLFLDILEVCMKFKVGEILPDYCSLLARWYKTGE